MTKQKIEQLVNQIKEASELYYNTENPIMTDEQFDKLVEELRELDPSNEVLKSHDWGNSIKSHNGKILVPHRINIKGITRKIKNYEEALDALEGRSIEAKLDGIAGFCYYEGGKLKHVLTRNNGSEGIDIKNNINTSKIEDLIKGDGVVQVEIVMKIADWKLFYDPTQNPSPRNLIAGICSKIDVTELEKSIATPVILDVLEGFDGSRSELMSRLRNCKNLDVVPAFDMLPEGLVECDYLIDGYVLKTEDPDDEVFAFKPTGETAVTEVIDITWGIGNTGKLTPVLTVQPVILSGARIMRVTGNSASMMESLGTGIGAKVRIRRSGEVIPQIIEVLEPSNDFKLPEFDRREGAHIFRDITLNMWKNATNFITWVKGASSSLYNKVQEIYDIKDKESYERFIQSILHSVVKETNEFTSHEWDLILEGYSILRSMSKQEFLSMLNLPNIGDSAINKIIKNEKLPVHSERTWNTYRDQICEVSSYLYLEHGIELAVKEEEIKGSKGYVAITGKHEGIKRGAMESIIRMKGYEIHGSVNKDTNFLIIADVNSTSSKAVSARKLGVKLLSSVDELI